MVGPFLQVLKSRSLSGWISTISHHQCADECRHLFFEQLVSTEQLVLFHIINLIYLCGHSERPLRPSSSPLGTENWSTVLHVPYSRLCGSYIDHAGWYNAHTYYYTTRLHVFHWQSLEQLPYPYAMKRFHFQTMACTQVSCFLFFNFYPSMIYYRSGLTVITLIFSLFPEGIPCKKNFWWEAWLAIWDHVHFTRWGRSMGNITQFPAYVLITFSLDVRFSLYCEESVSTVKTGNNTKVCWSGGFNSFWSCVCNVGRTANSVCPSKNPAFIHLNLTYNLKALQCLSCGVWIRHSLRPQGST